MNEQDISAVVKGIAPTIRQFVEEKTAHFAARIDELQGKLASYESAAASLQEGFDGGLEKQIGPLLKRLEALEARAPVAPEKGERGEKGEPGKDGRDGKDADQAAIAALVATEVEKKVAALPKAKDGRDGVDGKDGKSADPSEAALLIKDEVKRALAEIPTPKDGRDGKDADGDAILKALTAEARSIIEALPKPKDGKDADEAAIKSALQTELRAMFDAIPIPKDGKDGRDGKDGEPPDPVAIERAIADRVEKAVKAIPAPKDGRDGIDGKDGRDGKDGAAGVSIKDVATDADGCLLVTLSNGDILRTKSVRGEDGLGFDDMRIESDGERTFRLVFERGDRIKTQELTIPSLIWRDVWEASEPYQKGDGVTYGGSIWIATRAADPNERPDQSDAWKLAVKKGRDGKPGKDGEKGDPGIAGRPGRDLTQMSADGEKW